MNEEEQGPLFDEATARDISLIIQMRIYDVLMSQFMLSHPEEADKLYNLHCEGGFLNPAPSYDPTKIVD